MERTVLYRAHSPKLDPGPTVCCISLHRTDRLRVISFPPNLLTAFRIAVQTSWVKGIQAEGPYGCSFQFKLRGNPWNRSKAEAVESHRLAVGIMRCMVSHGWDLELVTDLGKKHYVRNSWFFRKKCQETHVVMCGISFNSTDTMRVIDGFPDVTQIVMSAIESKWPRGLHHQRIYCEAQEFKLNGKPWTSNGKETMHAGALIMQLIDTLRSAGWRVYASVNISSVHEGKQLDWVLKKFKL